MANPIKGEVAVTLADGRELVLVADMDALVEAEDAYGKPLNALLAKAGEGFIGATRALVYGTLRRHHGDMTLADVSAILQSDSDVLGAALSEAITRAFPVAAGAEAGNAGNGPQPNRPSAPLGKTSGRSGAKRG